MYYCNSIGCFPWFKILVQLVVRMEPYYLLLCALFCWKNHPQALASLVPSNPSFRFFEGLVPRLLTLLSETGILYIASDHTRSFAYTQHTKRFRVIKKGHGTFCGGMLVLCSWHGWLSRRYAALLLRPCSFPWTSLQDARGSTCSRNTFLAAMTKLA